MSHVCVCCIMGERVYKHISMETEAKKAKSPIFPQLCCLPPRPWPLTLSLFAVRCNKQHPWLQSWLGGSLLTGQKSSNPAPSHLLTASQVTGLHSLQNSLHIICLEVGLAPILKDGTSPLDCNHFYLIFCPARKFWLLSSSLEAVFLVALRDSGQRLNFLTIALHLFESRP